jgi:two-component system sensor histidine kinase RegB
MLVCFVLDIVLLVLFFSRINANLRRRDERLADLRQQAAEEDHIVRMGLLASGAAHELGTPLSTLSVILGDWRHLPEFRDHPERRQELDEMQAELKRCKNIVSGILLAAGEARGESPTLTTAARFLDELVAEWRGLHQTMQLDYQLEEPLDASAFRRMAIVSDSALRQVIFNVLENAREASPTWASLSVRCADDALRLTVRDRGPGFTPEMLARLGKPYHSSKGRPGGGLGLFLVVNVLRKLGGKVQAANAETGGAVVTLLLPLSTLTIAGEEPTNG